MKILAIGDFHGKFPKRLKRKAEKEDIDFIISLGDYANADKIRKLIFKYWTDKPWHEAIGMKKARELEKESFYSGTAILKELNSIKKPVYLIWGNTDFYKDYKFSSPPVIMPGYYEKKIKKMKNLVLLDKRKKSIGKTDVMGHGGYLDVTDYIKYPVHEDKKSQKKILRRYKNDERRLKKLFSRKKPKNGFIFAIHYTPYGYFDKITSRKNPMYNKHVGWEPYNNLIKKYKPMLVICGHMHEYQGMRKIGKSVVVNTGAAYEGKAALIEIDEERKKVKSVKFIK